MATTPSTPTWAVLSPSGTPTFGLGDVVTAEWIAPNLSGDVAIFCNQNGWGLVLTGTEILNNQVTSVDLSSLGSYYQAETWITSWPATCFIDVDNVGSGGDFIFTSDASPSASPSPGPSPTSPPITNPISSGSVIFETSIVYRTSNVVPPNTSLISSSSASSTSTSKPSPSSLSPGSIAGVVIGAVAGLALICLAAWYIMRNKRKNKETNNWRGPVDNDGGARSHEMEAAHDTSNWKHASAYDPAELASGVEDRHELPGN